MSQPGRNIGRYRILEQVGSGGMSVVYKGLDTTLDREVAVKVLHPHLSGKEESRKRLAREAKAVAKLHHPNILEIFDFSGAESEDAYIVTEYIRGQTLRQFVQTERIEPPEVAAMIIHQLAAALAHAHELGIIHRDLKPENVMVRADGVLKLMDFGIAKIIDRDDKMTMTGALVGSPAHMAPEIIEGEEATAEADVFSLGTMLYALATTRLPFYAANTTATLKRILDGTYEDPRRLVPSLSDELAEIIATCLVRQPSERYSNARELQDALTDHLGSLGLTHISEELAAYFTDPAGHRKVLTERLTEALLKKSERHLAEQRPARALASLNQILALNPREPRAHAAIARMNAARRREKTVRRVLQASAGVVGAVALGLAGVRVYEVLTAAPDYVPGGERMTELVLPARLFPEPQAKPPPPVVVPTKHVPEAKAQPTIARVPVRILVRPFGYVRVNEGERSAQALQLHTLSLPAGKHRVTVSCDLCLDTTEQFDVQAGRRNEFHVAPALKPSRLAFDFEPKDAMVTIRGITRSVQESLRDPFNIVSPRGQTSLRHQVEYRIKSPGYADETKTVWLTPGEPLVLRGALTRQAPSP